MPTITITFHEEGQEPASFRIGEVMTAKLDRFVADTRQPDGTPLYPRGKMQLFGEFAIANLLRKIDEMYPDMDPTELLALYAQAEALKAQIEQLKRNLLVEQVLVDPPEEP
jgi:hypothetical protein